MSSTPYLDLSGWQAHYDVTPSTSSNAACQAFDAAVRSYYRWGAPPDDGDIIGMFDQAIAHDTSFFTAHVSKAALFIMSSGVAAHSRSANQQVASALSQAEAILKQQQHDAASSPTLQAWEVALYHGVQAAASGNMSKAASHWEEVLLECPREPMALKLLHDTYFYFGQSLRIRDSIARVFPYLEQRQPPLFGNVCGMLAFGLEEVGDYGRAYQYATRALALDAHDAWATHARLHIYEMQNKRQIGLDFASSTESDWSVASNLATHNYWHMALFHMGLGQHDAAMDVYENRIGKRAAASGEILDLVDASSLLYRLQLDGASKRVTAEHYAALLAHWESHIDDHFSVFNDAHILMTTLGAGDTHATERLMQSVVEFANQQEAQHECSGFGCSNSSSSTITNVAITRRVGIALLQAIEAFDARHYERTIELLEAIRYNVIEIGGSHAQRDVFQLLLMAAAVRCTSDRAKRVAAALLHEREFNQQATLQL
jgi:tetratricopeptide (TPR) repeat protein